MGTPDFSYQPAPPPPIPQYKLYDVASIGLATFFGTPVAGAILMGMNASRLKKGSASAIVLSAVLFTAAMIALGYWLSTELARVVTIVPLVTMISAAKSFQGPAIEAHKIAGGQMESRWKAFGLGLLALAAVPAGSRVRGSEGQQRRKKNHSGH
jgi:hypothetical protein